MGEISRLSQIGSFLPIKRTYIGLLCLPDKLNILSGGKSEIEKNIYLIVGKLIFIQRL